MEAFSSNPSFVTAPAARRSLLHNPKFLAISIALIGVLVLLPNAGSKRPLESHEAYVPLVAAEMLRSDNFIIPYFNGKPRLEKPPLSYWLVAGLHRLTGKSVDRRISELEARLPSILAAIVLLFVTMGIGKAVFNDMRVGWVAAVLLATSQGFFKYGHNARPDMVYSLFCTIQIFGLLYLQRAEKSLCNNIIAGLLIWSGFAGAIFSKGPLVPIIFMVSAGLVFFIFRSKPSRRLLLQLAFGLITIVAVGIYFLYLSQHLKGATELWKQEIIQSSSIPFWSRPIQNGWYFLKVTIRLARPWLLLLPLSLFSLWRNRKPESWILGLAIVILICSLTFSGKMREHYMLPALPILFVLVGWGCVHSWDHSFDSPMWSNGVSLVVGGHALFFAIGVIVLGFKAFHIEPIKNIHPVYQVLPFLAGAFWAILWTLRKVWQQSSCAFVGLLLAAVLLYAGMGAGAFNWKTEYYSAAKFGKSIASLAKGNQLAIIEPCQNVPSILFYSGSHIQRYRFSELDKLIRDYPEALIIIEARRIEQAGVKGEIVLQENRIKKKYDQLVLFKPLHENS